MTSQYSTALQPNAPADFTVPFLNFAPRISSISASSTTVLDRSASVRFNGVLATQIGSIHIAIDGSGGRLGIFDSTLSVEGTSGNIAYQYSAANQVLTLVGNSNTTEREYTNLLQKVAFDSTGSSLDRRSISVNMGRPLYNFENGHYYEFIPFEQGSPLSWSSAKAAAADRVSASDIFKLTDIKSYLATVTSANENTFLTDRFESKGWIGGEATGSGTARTWRWATGPELGQTYWIGNESGSATGTATGYANWASGEPNPLSNEPYANLLQNGKWNDLANTPTAQTANFIPDGYWVEYSLAAGTGDDRLADTRTRFNFTVTAATNTGTQDSAALDLVYYNPANGQISFAFVGTDNNIVKMGLDLAGDTPKLIGSGNPAGSTESGANWKLVSADVDVDNDQFKDLIIRNSNNGQIVFLFGENRTTTQRRYAYSRYAFLESGGQTVTNAQDWSIDFASSKLGANGNAGLMWRNAGSGVAGVGGLTTTVDATRGGGMKVVHAPAPLWLNVGANSGWYSVGDGEFNANETNREVLWRNTKTNDVTVWSYNADRSALASANAISFGGRDVKLGSEWAVSSIANVDLMGNDDIVWQKGTDVSIWKMTNNNVISGALVTVNVGDQLKDVADIDKDGVLDLIAQNDIDGTIGFYTLKSDSAGLSKKNDRRTYTLGNAAYKPGKGTGNAGLELVNVAQYDTV